MTSHSLKMADIHSPTILSYFSLDTDQVYCRLNCLIRICISECSVKQSKTLWTLGKEKATGKVC